MVGFQSPGKPSYEPKSFHVDWLQCITKETEQNVHFIRVKMLAVGKIKSTLTCQQFLTPTTFGLS